MGMSLGVRLTDQNTVIVVPRGISRWLIQFEGGDIYTATSGDFLMAVDIRTRHHSPETNGVVERFNQSIKYEHLFRLEMPDAITLSDEAEAFRRLYNEVRPHESLDFATPLSRYLADPNEPNLFEPKSVQDS